MTLGRLFLAMPFLFYGMHFCVNANHYYHWVDAEGTQHFSDTAPISDPQISHVTLLDLPQKSHHIRASDSKAKAQEIPKEKPLNAQKIKILFPKDQTTIRQNDGQIQIQFSTDHPLGKEQKVHLLLDDNQIQSATKSPIQLSQINRGTHEIRLHLIEKGRLIAQSRPIKIYLHRASAITPPNQAVMAVKAPTLTSMTSKPNTSK